MDWNFWALLFGWSLLLVAFVVPIALFVCLGEASRRQGWGAESAFAYGTAVVILLVWAFVFCLCAAEKQREATTLQSQEAQ